MACTRGGHSIDQWSEILATEGEQQQQENEVVYRRKKTQNTSKDVDLRKSGSSCRYGNRVNFVAGTKRVSWNRSLSTRGRSSIACMIYLPQMKPDKRKGKPALPKGKFVQPPNFEKERAYFEEVDAFELVEESPSPKKLDTWAVGNKTDSGPVPLLCTRLEKWLMSKKLNHGCGPSSTLSKILDTPSMALEPIADFDLPQTPQKSSVKINSQLYSDGGNEGSKCIEAAVKKLSLISLSDSADSDKLDPFDALLAACGQLSPAKLHDVFSKYCDIETIAKVGEGTYGEAFRIGNYVCKIVPVNGDLRVNGEVQKRSEELLDEVILSRTLNQLRGKEGDAYNSCKTFIETIDIRVCQGTYDAALIKAWEDWDEKHGSENDHPKEFPEKQCYVVFVLENGGKDLESFVLQNFDEARSLLVQVATALAVAESEYEFEHRDLHWGNILLSQNDSETLQFIVEGKVLLVKTYGLFISIIDFTLSRINTGDNILFLDLSMDPYLFKGPKGDKQSETYRKMKEVTEDYWEGSFPKTNVLWLLYLVDMLLQKKSFDRTSKNERDLRSLKKRLDKYTSAKEAMFDPFFSDLFVEHD
ncbi:putative Serine/threonine-protein kinase Haspin [Quillaja saponaria]|uniref:non-specific serine/threonine protein kinase n=1 Tax=Quillaja saponaria TaxID=32244 RepID=A0AAD7Q249_QUISA|nr:putative Serine/threonine-protein kinase Haspin [Quillaja saponaria]